MELESNDSLPFLDIQIYKENDGQLRQKVYEKSDIYMPHLTALLHKQIVL